MVVNFRTRGISRDTRKLARTLTLNSKKKNFRVLYVGLYFRAMGFFGLFACEHDR